MATIQIPPPAEGEVIRPNPGRIVQVKRSWEDAWETVDYLEARRAQACVEPNLGQAEFRYAYGEIKREDDSSFEDVSPYDVRNHYVRIQLQAEPQASEDEAGNDSEDKPKATSLWYGFFPDDNVEHAGQSIERSGPSGDQNPVAYELGFLLDRTGLRGARVEDNGAYKTIGWLPDFNVKGKRGLQIIGNRSAGKEDRGAGLSQAYVFQANGGVWDNLQVLEHLLAYHLPADGPEVRLAGQTELLANVKAVHRFEGKTLRQAINHLVDRKRGMGWYLRVTENPDYEDFGGPPEYIEICVFSVFGQSISAGSLTIPGNENRVTPTRIEEDIEVEQATVRLTNAVQYDKIVVQGARIKSCFSVSHADGTVERGWNDVEENAYKNVTGDDNNQKDAERKTDRFARVYQCFLIPDTWGWFSGDGVGGGLFNNCAPKPLLTGGAVDIEQGQYWNHPRPLLRYLPIRKESNLEGAAPEFLEPLVVGRDLGGRWHQVDRCQNDEYPDGDDTEKLSSCSVRMLDTEMGFEVKASKINHQLAMGHFIPGDFEGSNHSDQEPELDWQSLIATVCCETDERLRVEAYGAQFDGLDWTRELVIDVPTAEYWWIAAETIVGVTDGGLVRQAAGQALRDDTATLQAIAALAKAWYGQARAKIEIVYKRIEAQYELGQYLEQIGSDWHEQVGTVVSSKAWDFAAGKTTVQTGYWEVDVAGMVDVPGLSDLRAVGREILRQGREIEDLWSHVGNFPVRPATGGAAGLGTGDLGGVPPPIDSQAGTEGEEKKAVRNDAKRGLTLAGNPDPLVTDSEIPQAKVLVFLQLTNGTKKGLCLPLVAGLKPGAGGYGVQVYAGKGIWVAQDVPGEFWGRVSLLRGEDAPVPFASGLEFSGDAAKVKPNTAKGIGLDADGIKALIKSLGGLGFSSGEIEVLVDGTTITKNGSGQLVASGSGLPSGSGQYKVLQLNASNQAVWDYPRGHS